MNVTKIILTRCQIFHLKCTKFNFGWGSTPEPAGGLTALPESQLDFGKMEGNGERGRRKNGRGWAGEGEGE